MTLLTIDQEIHKVLVPPLAVSVQNTPFAYCYHSYRLTDMASVLRFQDIPSLLTPPPSDRGECEDMTMLHSDSYSAEVFYPSPAPSFSHHTNFVPHSPDMGHSDSTYDTEEDNQHLFFVSAPESHSFDNSNNLHHQHNHHTTSLQNAALYSTAMPYQSYEPSSWISYAPFPSTATMFPCTSEDSSAPMYSTAYIPQASNNALPPVPQGVTRGSFSFNEPMFRAQDSSNYLGAYSNSKMRQHSPTAPSTTSASGGSSRSCSPGLSTQAMSESQSNRRPSLLHHRQSSSSLHAYGIPIRSPDTTAIQAWRCAFPNCTSRAIFTRGCDLRKHYNRHSKHLFCRVDGCPQSEAACVAVAQQQAIQAGAEISDPSKLAVTGGFSSKKDRARHEAKHNPGIKCEWTGPNGEECGRLFSRMDNMKDHVRRIHNKGQPQSQPQSSSNKKKSIQ